MLVGSVRSLRPAVESDAPALRALLNTAYAELAAAGWSYTASYQDESETHFDGKTYDSWIFEEDLCEGEPDR